MQDFLRIFIVTTAIAAASICAADALDELEANLAKSTIIVEATENACYRFDVYLAMTWEQQRRGLMEVRRMPEFTGMLFSYGAAEIRSMWMRNTYLPLDILFIRDDGSIANIVTDTEPLSLASISSTEPVSHVLELNAGITTRLHIDTDSRVHF